jgi:hypothetical protein
VVRTLIFSYPKQETTMSPDRGDSEFAAALSRLRRTGAAVLVVGAVPDRLHRLACEGLLGAAGDERLFVRTGRTGIAAEVPTDADRVVELETTPRGAVAESADGTTETLAGEFSGTNMTRVQTLAAAGAAVEEALPTLDTADAPRVCVDSVVPLVETAGEEQAFRFCHLVGAHARRLDGSCHLHLSLPAGSEVAATFGALADATVELRLRDDRAEQRWLIPDEDIRSDWLPLEPA